MAERMLKFVGTPQAMPDKRPAAERRRDFQEIYALYARREGRRTGRPLLAMRRAVLPGPLPAAQQHPRLAEAHRRGPAGGGLRALLGDQQLPRDLRPHLPAGPAVRRQLRDREGLRQRSPSARSRSYITDTAWEQGWVKPIQPRARARAVGRHHRRRPGRPGRRRAAAPQGLPGRRSTTATTGSAAC